jgi:hypothetical protein
MQLLNRIYIRTYFIIMMMYAFFNKGIAYSYLAEVLLIAGVILIFLNRRLFEIHLDKKNIIIIILITIIFIYILFGLIKYDTFNVIRDSLAIQYAWFAIILFYFKDELNFIWESLIQIYKWVPLVLFLNFLLFYYVILKLPPIEIFGGQHILLYKNGDKSLHLLISSILIILFTEKYSRNWLILNSILIFINLLILLAFTRSGSLAYLAGIFCFFFFSKTSLITDGLRKVLKFIPFLSIIVFGVFAAIEIEGDAQGRTISLSQITNNFSSIVSSDIDGSLTDNKVWRLVWWAKLLNESFTLEHFFIGKGLGMSLAGNELISVDENLRSPHNFHLTIIARFGYIIFFIWLYWLWLLFKPLFTKKLSGKILGLTCILLANIINGSFDVFFEGPMGAFPFWTMVGLLLIEEYYNAYKPNEMPN